jgi:hypothetical protein
MAMAPHDLAQVSRKPQTVIGFPMYNDKAGKGSMAMGKGAKGAAKGPKPAMGKKGKPAKGGGMKAK